MCDRWGRYSELMRLGEEALLLSLLRPTDADRPDGPFKSTVAHLAAEFGHAPLLRELHRMGVSLSRVTALGDTVAHFAARGGHTKVMEFLISLADAPPEEEAADAVKRAAKALETAARAKAAAPTRCGVVRRGRAVAALHNGVPASCLCLCGVELVSTNS